MVKAHKPTKNYPMRIVVSTIGSPPYETSKYLVNIIQPTLNKSNIRVINSSSFVTEAKQWTPDPNEIQVSYDAVNLYPSVPIKKATDVIMDILSNDFDDVSKRTKLSLTDIRTLINLCLKKCYFTWQNQIRVLDDAGPIGLSLMVVMAEGFLQHIEQQSIAAALRTTPPVAPIIFKRYVDDTYSRFRDKTSSEQFLEILNAQEPRIQFTSEYENEDNELNFLDVTLKNTKNNKYLFKVYRKDAITNVQIKPSSSIAPNVKDGVIKGFISRAYAICSPESLDAELEFLQSMFVENGYDQNYVKKIVNTYRPGHPKPDEDNDFQNTASIPWIPGLSTKLKKPFKNAGIRVTFKSTSNLQSILCKKNKSTIDTQSTSGVYMIPCSCGKQYVGETGATVKTRIKQHQKAVFENKKNDSALAEHADVCQGNVQWDNASILASESKFFRRSVRESLEIQRQGTAPGQGLNKDTGRYVKTNTWLPLLKKIV